MFRQYRQPRKKLGKGQCFLLLCLILVLWVSVPISINLIESLIGQSRNSSAILVLGGQAIREEFAAKFAINKPQIPIWVSSGSPKEYVERIFERAGIARDRLHIDYRAVDTLTNFTTLVDDFRTRKINQVYLITEEFHMPRAKMIGNIVFGSRGIKLKPIAVPSNRKKERIRKTIRDTARSVLWLFTGAAPTKDEPQVEN
jgi:uncharacterized SAM-binding protein YcdF (DUF218 family)